MSSIVETSEAKHANTAPQTEHQGPSVKLKASLAPMTALELSRFIPDEFDDELSAKIAQAPSFFENLPVLIGLEKYQEHSLDFSKLIEICEKHSVKAIAVRGANEALAALAKQSGLGLLAKQKEKGEQDVPTLEPKPIAQPQVSEVKSTEAPTEQTTSQAAPEPVVKISTQVSKVVNHPIRSGQQVYAADGDLIILASVSAGAEILADGNIHVYGALRGRALAGVKGNTKARIFCHSLGAELVSIAGQYKISEDIPGTAVGKPSQVYLEDDAIKFKELEL